jgi:hypothetical protein
MIVLYEPDVCVHGFAESLFVETLQEKSTLVLEDSWFDELNLRKRSRRNAHQ